MCDRSTLENYSKDNFKSGAIEYQDKILALDKTSMDVWQL